MHIRPDSAYPQPGSHLSGNGLLTMSRLDTACDNVMVALDVPCKRMCTCVLFTNWCELNCAPVSLMHSAVGVWVRFFTIQSFSVSVCSLLRSDEWNLKSCPAVVPLFLVFLFVVLLRMYVLSVCFCTLASKILTICIICVVFVHLGTSHTFQARAEAAEVQLWCQVTWLLVFMLFEFEQLHGPGYGASPIGCPASWLAYTNFGVACCLCLLHLCRNHGESKPQSTTLQWQIQLG